MADTEVGANELSCRIDQDNRATTAETIYSRVNSLIFQKLESKSLVQHISKLIGLHNKN